VSRTYTNAQVDRVRRVFRWAAAEEMISGSVYENLRSVPGLHRGKTEARETEKIRPVCQEHMDAALPHMQPTVQAMVRFQLLTGCRPAEVCVLRPMDLDMRNPSCWLFRPGSDQGPEGQHKTAHHAHDRLILIGPRAQEILRPYLGTKLDAYCFSPAESEPRRNGLRRHRGECALTVERKKGRPRKRRRRAPGDRYDTHSYRRAIARACYKTSVPVWAPNRLRHSRATKLRPQGLDVAKTILGHSKVETTQVYAEKDLAAAMELVSKLS
jgi:integrase